MPCVALYDCVVQYYFTVIECPTWSPKPHRWTRGARLLISAALHSTSNRASSSPQANACGQVRRCAGARGLNMLSSSLKSSPRRLTVGTSCGAASRAAHQPAHTSSTVSLQGRAAAKTGHSRHSGGSLRTCTGILGRLTLVLRLTAPAGGSRQCRGKRSRAAAARRAGPPMLEVVA